MSTEARTTEILEEWHSICGLENLQTFHFNDSQGGLGSRRDRHAHIGQGCVSRVCFRTILNHAALQTVPKILETPKGTDESGVEWDLVNIRVLKRMTRRPHRADNGPAGIAALLTRA